MAGDVGALIVLLFIPNVRLKSAVDDCEWGGGGTEVVPDDPVVPVTDVRGPSGCFVEPPDTSASFCSNSSAPSPGIDNQDDLMAILVIIKYGRMFKVN